MAHYEDYPEDSGDSFEFAIELVIDCNRVPYETPVIEDYTHVID